MSLRLYNTLHRGKEDFVPLDAKHVRMYVCGPTVYDHAHIGNARPAIVFDVLYRLLRHLYGTAHVTYVRNLTDVDDKINARAAEEGVSIGEVTARTIAQYHADVAALQVLPPDVEPRATEHIDGMIHMIGRLINSGHAYVSEGHVLFRVASDASYGCLSNRSRDEMMAGARVEVADYKYDPMDFVLWKPSTPILPGWDSPWGRGRPGWHIECSVMSEKYLGPTFDIHGGGADLIFPHHENEIAQSTCAHGNEQMARYWVHNGYLQVEGEKMSKSLGNFITIHELLETDNFGGRKWPGEVLRLAMLMTHYRESIDWTIRRLEEASKIYKRWLTSAKFASTESTQVDDKVSSLLSDDLNTYGALIRLGELAALVVGVKRGIHHSFEDDIAYAKEVFLPTAHLLGFDLSEEAGTCSNEKINKINECIEARNEARAGKNWAEADRIRDELTAMDIILKDGPEGTSWEVKR